jgi:hypothetical protein
MRREDAMCAGPGNESKRAWRLAPCVLRCCTKYKGNVESVLWKSADIGLHWPANHVGMNSLQGWIWLYRATCDMHLPERERRGAGGQLQLGTQQ